MYVLILLEKKMYLLVIVFNNVMEFFNVGCSDGFFVDIILLVILNFFVWNLKIIFLIGCINNFFWYVSEDLRCIWVICNKICFLN